MAVEFINGNEVQKYIDGNEKVVVNFFATWCGPCKMLAPILEDISKDHPVVKIDIDLNQDFARQEGIAGIPATRVYKNGKLVDQIVGFTPKEKIVELLK